MQETTYTLSSHIKLSFSFLKSHKVFFLSLADIRLSLQLVYTNSIHSSRITNSAFNTHVPQRTLRLHSPSTKTWLVIAALKIVCTAWDAFSLYQIRFLVIFLFLFINHPHRLQTLVMYTGWISPHAYTRQPCLEISSLEQLLISLNSDLVINVYQVDVCAAQNKNRVHCTLYIVLYCKTYIVSEQFAHPSIANQS